MRKNTASLVALVVLAAATLLMIFVVLPNVGDEAAPTGAGADTGSPVTSADGAASMPGAASGGSDTKAADAKGNRPVAGDAADPAKTTAPPVQANADQANSGPSAAPGEAASSALTPSTPAGSTAPTETAAASSAPSFDILRVEPDGSTVIAGRATPNSKLEIVNGNAVVGTADVGGTGDFAAVFDKPLPPGDYQLTLRSTAPSGAVTASDEVATVSVPRVANGQLLAMVTKPGEASRILTAPGELATPPASPSGSQGDQAALATPEAGVPAPAAGMPSSEGGPGAAVAVSAVEIEGRRLFVAGTARAGSTVRIYADDQLVGEGLADAQGRFVIDGETSLSIGQHVIRVDMVGADGKVQMRAAVPFERPEGDQISAIAQAPAGPSDPAFDRAIFDASRTEAAKAFALLKGLYADGKLPGLDQLAAARSATEIALTSLAGVKPAAGIRPGVAERLNATTKAAGDALAILKPLPRDAAAVGAALGRLDTAMARVLETATGVVTEGAVAGSQTPTGQTGAGTAGGTLSNAPGTSTAPSAQTAGGEPETVQQAPLQQSKSSVIIRRGDTLWQISRRVYGAGVRYTTIYVANEDQILDPDRILPGQVFGVPVTALPDAESQEIHRRHMQHTP